jgi:NADH-quinone oxidoreductase subunit F
MMVFDETDCVVGAALRFTRFYAHESCGKCTNCREGTWWLERVLRRIEAGIGRDRDIDLAKDIGGNMLFKAFCALADGAVSPVDSSIKYFRDEYEEHLRLGRCPFVPVPAAEAPAPLGAGARATDVEGAPDGDGRTFGPSIELDEVLG